MKSRTTTIVLTACAILLASCSTSDGQEEATASEVAPPANLVNEGKLTYGVAATFPPFEYKEDGIPTGFDVEMAEALADAMGLEVEILDIDFDGLIPALTGNRVDIINSAMYINEERSEKVDFIPYMNIGETLIVREDSDITISDVPKDLSGLTVAVTRGAIGETFMNGFNDELNEAGIPPMEVMTLPTNQDALVAVQSGRADAFDTSTPGGAFTLSETEGLRQEAIFALETQIGIAIRKGDDDTKEALTNALHYIVDKGTFEDLMEEYNLPAEGNIFD